MEKYRVPRRLQQVTAKIIYLCPTYIDYLAFYPEGEKHKFASLNKKYFDKDRWDQFIGILEEAVRWDIPLHLTIETIEETPEKGHMQRHDYIIDANRIP